MRDIDKLRQQLAKTFKEQTAEDILDIELSNMYMIGKVLKINIDENYPYFRYLMIKEEIKKDPEFKMNSGSVGTNTNIPKRFR